MGQDSSPRILNPALVIPVRNLSVLALNCLHLEGSFRMLKTSIAAPTIGGGTLLENRYGLPFCRRISMISACPVVYPPVPPPRAINIYIYIYSTHLFQV